MLDATLNWKASATGTPTSYMVVWSYNGAAQPAQKIPASAAQDAAGYSVDFANANPSLAVKAGDIIGASVQAVDEANNLSSAPVNATPVTIPAAPVAPGDPQNVTLVAS